MVESSANHPYTTKQTAYKLGGGSDDFYKVNFSLQIIIKFYLKNLRVAPKEIESLLHKPKSSIGFPLATG